MRIDTKLTLKLQDILLEEAKKLNLEEKEKVNFLVAGAAKLLECTIFCCEEDGLPAPPALLDAIYRDLKNSLQKLRERYIKDLSSRSPNSLPN